MLPTLVSVPERVGMNIERLRQNVGDVRGRIAEAEHRSGRSSGGVKLVAVTKRQPIEAVRALIDCGASDLGENYPQELWSKVEALPDPKLRWHLIGHLQGNKAKRTLPLVVMVHGVDSLKLLQNLDELAESLPNPPSVCLQANLSGEESKHGWTYEAMLADSEVIAACQKISIVGLMTMAGYGTTDEEARPTFSKLRELRDQLRTRSGLALAELSMGMSGDFVAAVEEGATLVRVGSAFFEGIET